MCKHAISTYESDAQPKPQVIIKGVKNNTAPAAGPGPGKTTGKKSKKKK